MISNSNMNPLIIIPARGGSKGIPKKNIVPLNGCPLIDYTIKAALEIAPAERIILSTDSEEIAAVARRCGLDVPYMRPAELATDTAGSREVILDVMDWADRRGISYDAVVLLQPTSPLRTADDIAGAMALYADGTDMVVSVTEARSNPYYNCFETDADGCLHVSKGDGLYTRRQDRSPRLRIQRRRLRNQPRLNPPSPDGRIPPPHPLRDARQTLHRHRRPDRPAHSISPARRKRERQFQ